jgi:phosphoribosylamine--glycine ligase
MAAGGYPNEYATGHTVNGIEDATAGGCLVFHAGTKVHNGRIVTSGGRVLNVTGFGSSLHAAAGHAYSGVRRIQFPQAQYRTDIGRKS